MICQKIKGSPGLGYRSSDSPTIGRGGALLGVPIVRRYEDLRT
jgi:hypothetical protein